MNKFPFIFLCFVTAACCSAQQSVLTPEHQIARDIFKELIEINTTDTPAGKCNHSG